ncbi:hypothetical protein BS78_05G130600 [Paspalum vaginatum]|nr:hypothetical protein BS78_05G130600 [Paspalum vaginatum]
MPQSPVARRRRPRRATAGPVDAQQDRACPGPRVELSATQSSGLRESTTPKSPVVRHSTEKVILHKPLLSPCCASFALPALR